MVPVDYRDWITELKTRYRRTQIKAAVAVNSVLLEFYWELGKDIDERFAVEESSGSALYKRLSADLTAEIPYATGFSPRNLQYIHAFYKLYSSLITSVLGGKSQKTGLRQATANFCQILGKFIFGIPWGHHVQILNKCGTDAHKAFFYVRRTMENGWSRNSLLNWLSTDLYEREGKAQTNFALTMPSPDSDLAQQLTKDPYIFEIQGISEQYHETELKKALTSNIKKILMELGRGFAFVGREYIIGTEETEQRIDLMFYLVPLHRYVVVEVKTGKFETAHLGQLTGYVALVNATVNTPGDNPAIGLLICKERDSTLARYVLNEIDAQIGVSKYELSQALPKEFKSDLPSVEELEAEIQAMLENSASIPNS